MNILGKIKERSISNPTKIAFHSRFGEITYSQLWNNSDRLAAWLNDKLENNKKPVVVFGHKDPMMLVCFLACAKSGRAYCPVDISMPEDRINAIIDAVDNTLVLATEPLERSGYYIADKGIIESGMNYDTVISEDCWNKPEDIFYIIFTSGSTGKPKGVQITDENLSRYVDWSENLGDDVSVKNGAVFMNQAPFSFDLSVMDTYTSMASGCTLWGIDKKLQSDALAMMKYMKEGKLNYWVSTPSFADMCLADPAFDHELLPELRAFLFCGEKLAKNTASELMKRFPGAKVINTYGPTESTVAVTSVEINDEILAAPESLPIGIPKDGTEIRIIKEDGTVAAPMEKGEIQILGDTVSPGYYKNDKKTQEVFSVIDDKNKTRAYMTGDEGYLTSGGMLYYVGRIDLQVKLHGYRIELGDIESNLLKIDSIQSAAVVPKWQNGKIRYLAAFVTSDSAKGSFEDRKAVKEALKKMLPDYMVPKKISFIEQLPLTNNGKADRKKLEAMV